MINSGYRQLYYALPTGVGKTRIITMLVDLYRHAGRVLIVAHRKELIEQTVASIREDIEGVDVGIVMAKQNEIDARIVVGTWQSLTPNRLEDVLQSTIAGQVYAPFSLVIFDESHHAIGGSAYERIMQQVQLHSPMVATVGCTATPFRSDKTSMQEVLPECAYLRTIPEMQKAGWLAPLHWKAIRLSMELPKRYAVLDGETDYNQQDLYDKLAPQTQGIVEKTAPYFGTRPVMVFAVNVEHAERLSAAYNFEGVCSMALCAETSRVIRKDTLDAWKSGAIQCVVNVGLFTEGFDYTPMVPNRNGLGVVVIACPTMSPSRYLQMVGRGTRLKPTEGDFKDCIVLDIGGNANLLETKQIVLPKVFSSLQEDIFERGDDLVKFDGRLEEELEEQEEGKDKQPTILRINDPLSTSWIAWGYNRMNDIYWSGLMPDVYAVIVPSQRKDGLYKAFILKCERGKWSRDELVARAKPLGELMHHINHVIAQAGARALLDKKRPWRKQQATAKQIALLAGLSPKYYAMAKKGGWNKGQVASILNWCKLVPQLKILVQEERKDVL